MRHVTITVLISQYVRSASLCFCSLGSTSFTQTSLHPLLRIAARRAVGIPTGWSTESGGFKKCETDEKKAIFCAFERLNLALHDQPGFDKVYYAADVNDTDNFGFSLFNPCDDIKKYLKKRLQTVPDRFGENNPIKSTKIEATENKLDDVAILDMMLHMPMSQKQKRARLKLEADDDVFQLIDQE